MFFYSCSWVISILSACWKKFLMFSSKESSEEFVLRSLKLISIDEAFCDAWWVTRIEICVLEFSCRLEVCLHLKDRILVESDTTVHFRVQKCSFCFWYFCREFDCRMEVVCLWNIRRTELEATVPYWYDVIDKPFQKMGLMLLCLSISFSFLAMKMLAKATAIFVPMAVPWVWR